MASSRNSPNKDSAGSSASHVISVPELTENDAFHVFISFSGADSPWVHQLIRKLEATFPSLQICCHDRDFTAGKTIIENMTECIERSQKIVMVLSPDFVRSRWCLFEANLSMFQDCMSHKAIVPVMLKPCPMPLYLSHLTYLEVEDEQFFDKLCNRLLKNNAKTAEEVLVHFQSSVLYGGKHLLSLAAVNEDSGNDDYPVNGVFSEASVPDALKAVVKDPKIYKEAIRLINNTPTSLDTFRSNWSKAFVVIYFTIIMFFTVLAFIFSFEGGGTWWHFLHLPLSIIPIGLAAYRLEYWKQHISKRVSRNMSRKTGEANLLLAETSILAGCASKSSLVFVFASLTECKEMFGAAFGSETELSQCMWRKAMIKYSSDYANCMAKKHFPPGDPQPPGHLPNGICFCQYVAMQIEQGHWP